ncbi:LacI family DNA-binding transcriptional regulator [Sulfitobacter sp. D35]|uniref:LacI family DNA-binding transcriptional regulator n=1 Tax=Sulfitobacter sp. D35 TaxID=3083252 RepID=UPI00296FD24C|nr:LacI family DNA-binding transcriptional regulator [Sulfitobacter sp. D35]MDW4499955.1 LacI family DNA-binding transcriptional regulator [Sulfitobacter sp. D35]
MRRATIKGIAEAAGVSTATVDRALNGRAGVSAANRHRVLSAARDLGYLPSEGMVILPSRPARLEFFIPFDRNAFMRDVIDSITDFASTLPLVDTCRVVPLDGIGPEALLPALDQVSLQTDGVGIITTDHPRTRDAVTALCHAGVRVVTLASDVTGTPRSAYVGVDNRAAGRTAAQVMGMAAGHLRGDVAVFLGSGAFHGHREREAGFREVMAQRYPEFKLLPAIETEENSDRSYRMTTRLLDRTEALRGIYCIGAGREGIVRALHEGGEGARPFVVMHDLTESSAAWLAQDRIDAVIDQNARMVGEQAVIRLLGSIAASTPLLPFKNIEPRIIVRENLPGGTQREGHSA